MTKITATTPQSTWSQASILWLLTNLIGAVGCGCLMSLNNSPFSSKPMIQEASYVTGFAAAGSLAVIPLAVPAMRKILGIYRRVYRLSALGGAVCSFFLVSTLGWMLFGNTMVFMVALAFALGGWFYLPAALVSASLIYRQWLFRPDGPTILSTDG